MTIDPNISFANTHLIQSFNLAKTTGNTSTEIDFSIILDNVFNKNFIATMTSRDAVLKEIRNCVVAGDEEKCRGLSKYINPYRKDFHVRHGCLHIDDKRSYSTGNERRND